jgi:AcrR family transcriptional regulator
MSKGEDSRRRIVERALQLASTVGLEGLTLGKLADDLGVSKSGLFGHFDDKQALQIAVLQHATEHFIQKVVAPALSKPRGEPRVRALFERELDWVGDSASPGGASGPGGCIFMACATELDDRPGPVLDYLVHTQRDWIETVARAAQIAVTEKHFRRDLDAEQFALEVQSLALGYNYALKLLKDPRARQRVEAAFEALLSRARSS